MHKGKCRGCGNKDEVIVAYRCRWCLLESKDRLEEIIDAIYELAEEILDARENNDTEMAEDLPRCEWKPVVCGGCIEHGISEEEAKRIPVWAGLWQCPECNNRLWYAERLNECL